MVSKTKMQEHGAGNSRQQHEQSKCQTNEKYGPTCARALGNFSCDTVSRLPSKILDTWEEITEIFKDAIFVF